MTNGGPAPEKEEIELDVLPSRTCGLLDSSALGRDDSLQRGSEGSKGTGDRPDEVSVRIVSDLLHPRLRGVFFIWRSLPRQPRLSQTA